MAIEERREALRNAVLDAMQSGQLATLLRTAKQQARKYHRHNLEDVMKEVLEDEHARVHSLVGAQTKKVPRPSAVNTSALMPRQAVQRQKKQRLATWASPPKARPGDASPPRGVRVMPHASDFSGQGFGSHTVPMPDFEEGGSSLSKSNKSVRQILPAYLRSGTLPQGPKGGRSSEHVSFNLSDSMDMNASAEERRESIQEAMAVAAPGDTDAVQALDVGDMTAYPLLGFDAELPTRSSATVKASLTQFESSAKGEAKPKRGILPPIHANKQAPPKIDDTQEATGMTGSVKDAKPDVSLPPVVPAPISMPVIIDD